MGYLYRGSMDNSVLKTPADNILPPLYELVVTEDSPDYFYVSQDNFVICSVNTVKPIRLYADSATSCVIIIAIGANGKICMSHLSRPGRFKMFFDVIKRVLTGEIEIFAAGANPPEPIDTGNGSFNYTALRNAYIVTHWAGQFTPTTENACGDIKRLTLRLGEGDPSIKENNLDCLGILTASQTSPNTVINNERIELTQEERDPTGGIQTLFCIYGNPDYTMNALETFTPTEVDLLVQLARRDNLQSAADMTDDEILHTYSSTPGCEVAWFADSIRQAANFVKSYTMKEG